MLSTILSQFLLTKIGVERVERSEEDKWDVATWLSYSPNNLGTAGFYTKMATGSKDMDIFSPKPGADPTKLFLRVNT